MKTATKKNLDGNVTTIAEAMEAADLNFIAEQSEIISGNGITSPTHKMIYRSDINQQIGIVGNGYVPVQNHDAFAFFDVIAEQHNASYSSVTSIENGSRIVVKAKFPDQMIINRDDVIQKEFTLVNSFDGSTSLMAYFTLERLVCTNGLRGKVKDAEHCVRLKHTKNIEAKLEAALRVFAISQEYYHQFEIRAKKMAETAVTKAMVNKFLNSIIGEEGKTCQCDTKREKVLELFESGKGNHGKTEWDLYNGLTEYVDHFSSKNDESRLVNSMIGSGVDLKEHAWGFFNK